MASTLAASPPPPPPMSKQRSNVRVQCHTWDARTGAFTLSGKTFSVNAIHWTLGQGLSLYLAKHFCQCQCHTWGGGFYFIWQKLHFIWQNIFANFNITHGVEAFTLSGKNSFVNVTHGTPGLLLYLAKKIVNVNVTHMGWELYFIWQNIFIVNDDFVCCFCLLRAL